MKRSKSRGFDWKPFLAGFAMLFLAVAPAAAKIPIILPTDVGNEIDDQWAIVYMLTNPEFEVLGIISGHAPSLTPLAAHTTYLCLLDVVETRLRIASHPPLFEGSSLPLQDLQTPRMNAGVDFIIEASKAFSEENRLNIATIGAVTDAASAILKDPAVSDRIRIVDMGFNGWPKGGDFFNIANDVKAMQVIMNSNVPLVVGPGDVCRADLSLNLDQAKNIVAGRGPVGDWLWQEYQAWYYRRVKPLRVNDFSQSWVIWRRFQGFENALECNHAGIIPPNALSRENTRSALARSLVSEAKNGVGEGLIGDVDQHRGIVNSCRSRTGCLQSVGQGFFAQLALAALSHSLDGVREKR
jgi:inosine-uridine nucleoside N-ribohydrolase